jgi:hypothetical protein
MTTQPDDRDVQHGYVHLQMAVRLSTLTAAEQGAILSILRLLRSAEAVAASAETSVDPASFLAGVSISLIDGARRELAKLVAP